MRALSSRPRAFLRFRERGGEPAAWIKDPWLYTGRVTSKQTASQRALMRVFRFHLEARTWIEITLGVLTFLAIILFYQSLLSPQISFANDRLALTNLRESWGQAVVGFGLRSSRNPRPNTPAPARAAPGATPCA